MTPESWLPKEEGNLFQMIKAMCAAAEANGQILYRLSIGQPMGPALKSARLFAASAIMSDEQAVHEYQDNGSPGCPDFAKRFVQSHLEEALPLNQNVAFLLGDYGVRGSHKSQFS
jgi:aspartate/methionine/tyrosine aminotransferase